MLPVNSFSSKAEEDSFQLLCQTKIESSDVPVSKYFSKSTGLHVIFAKVEGPLVGGYFTLGK